VPMSTGTELPKTATKTAASAMPGKLMTMSRMRMSTSDTTLPAVAAIEPRTAAASRAPAVAHRPMSSEVRAPWTTREKMSRPMASVPNQCAPLGGCTGVPVASGDWVATRGAKTATRPSRRRKVRTILLAIGRSRIAPRRAPAEPSRRRVSPGRNIRCS